MDNPNTVEYFTAAKMSEPTMRPPPCTRNVMLPSLHSNLSSDHNQNQNHNPNAIRAGTMLSPTNIPTHSRQAHNLTLPVQPNAQYSMFVPSRSGNSAAGVSYGPSATTTYPMHGGVSQARHTGVASSSSNQGFPHGNRYGADQSSSATRYHPTVSYNTSQVTNNANSESSQMISSPWNPNFFHGSSSNPHMTASTASTPSPLPYSPSQPIHGFHAASSSNPPTSNRTHAPSMMLTRARGRTVNAENTSDRLSPSAMNSGTSSISLTATQNHPPARRNLMATNPCESDPIRPRGNLRPGSNGFVNTNSNISATIQNSFSSTPSPIVNTRRRTRRTRSTPNPVSSANTVATTLTSSSRKTPAKVVKPRKPKKMEQKKIQPKDNKEQCSICLEIPSRAEVACISGCAHTFCFQCIEKWAERENTCPLCKIRFTKIERVNKPPPRKRKKGDGPRPKNTKRVKNRDQRADIGIGTQQLQGLLGKLGYLKFETFSLF